MSAKRLLGVVLTSALLVLLAGAASAVPADSHVLRTQEQPDGTTFRALLSGDEWAHWYETEDGYTVTRNEAGYWTYARRSGDGGLAASDRVVGGSAPSGERHLRPDESWFRQLADEKDAEPGLRPVPTVTSITGTQQAVILLVEFSDTPAGEGSSGPHDAAYFTGSSTGIVSGTSQGHLHHYYDEVSYGQLDVQAAVANDAWYQSAHTEIYYGEDCNPGACPPNLNDNCNVCIHELVREAIQLADADGFDFAPYDVDGNGVIDHVFVVHAGQDQASLAGGPDDIWSHRGTIPGGEPVDGKTVQGYMLLSEHDAMSAFAHEFAHDLGAPDLYDHDGDSEPVGPWCLMGTAWETDAPPHLCGLLKVDLDANFGNGLTGWTSAGLLTDEGTYYVDRLDQNATQSVLMTEPAFSNGERFLVENREASGFYESSLPESGIIFTHFDDAMPDGPGAFNDGPPSNSYHGAWIERPDHVPSPAGAAYSADDGEDRFGMLTIPNTNANGGQGTGLVFKNIGLEASSMSFDFQPYPTNVSGPITSNATWTLDSSPYVVSGDVTVEDGAQLTIEPGVVIKFQSSRRLTIHGVLVAAGTASQPIVFTAYTDDDYAGDTNGNGPSSGTRGYWIELLFQDSNYGCVLDHCIVRYAGRYYSSYYADAINIGGAGGSELIIRNSIIEQTGSSSYPYTMRIWPGTTVSIENTIIRDNTGYAVYSEGMLSMSNCLVQANERYGVYATGDNTSITNCRIEQNGYDGLYLTGNMCAVTSDTLNANALIGLHCNKVPAAFNNNISTNNGSFGYEVRVEVLTDTWNLNTIGINGRNGAIRVFGGSVNQSQTWTADHPLVIAGSVSVPDGVTLDLDPGVVLKFESNTALNVYGILTAEGEITSPIVFTSYRDDDHGGDTNGDGASSGSAGDWRHINFSSSDDICRLSHCFVRYAGHYYGSYSYYNHGIVLSGSGTQVDLDNVTIEFIGGDNSDYDGALYGYTGTVMNVADSTIRNSNAHGIYQQGSLGADSCQILDCGRYGICTTGSTNVTRCTVSGSTYYGIYSSSDGATITQCRSSENGYHGIYLTGNACTVVADTLESNGQDGLYCDKVPAAFHDNLSTGNVDFGYRIPGRMADDVWNSNTIGINGRGNAIGLLADSIDSSVQWIDEYPLAILGDITIPDGLTLTLEPGAILKFDADRSLNIYGSLVAEGAEADSIIFTSFTDDFYGDDTNGNGPSTGSPGDWDRLKFQSPDVGCSLTYCKIRYAGGDYTNGSYSYENAILLGGTGSSLTITNSVIEKSRATRDYTSNYYNPYAIYATSGTSLNISECEILNNQKTGVYAEGTLTLVDSHFAGNGVFGARITGANATVTGNTFENNPGTGLYWTELPAAFSGNVGQNNSGLNFAVRAEVLDQIWLHNTSGPNLSGNGVGITGGTVPATTQWIDEYPYAVYGNISVPDGVTLTLEPGVILKFDRYFGMTVDGVLLAEGTEGDPIVFSSYRDDDYGGDTNGDGAGDGTPGDWLNLTFNSPEVGCSLSHCIFRYAGYYHGTGNYYREAVVLTGSGAGLSMSNCTIERTGAGSTYSYAVRSYAGTTLQMSESVIQDNDGTGLYTEGTLGLASSLISSNAGNGVQIPVTTAVVNGCLAENNGGYGFHVHPELIGEIAADDSLHANGHVNSIGVSAGHITADDDWPGMYPLVMQGAVTIDPTATVLVHPGAVIKFNGAYSLTVAGGLLAQGTPLDKVIFTSYRDDAYGGDTNQDGIQSLPALGDWGNIVFSTANPASRLGWTVVSYGGNGGAAAVAVNNCDLEFSDCIVIHNLNRGIAVDPTGTLEIHNSDIYDNAFGLENLNTGVELDATHCFWGSITGPYNAALNPGGLGNPVSDHVTFNPWLDGSMDNPWVAFPSPATSGNYMDVLVCDFDGDPYPDLAAATEANGVKIWTRPSFDTWQAATPLISTGQWQALDRGNFNNDTYEDDLLACGPSGIRVFASNGAGSPIEVDAPLGGQGCKDAHFAAVDHDNNLDIVGCSGDNHGIYVFYGDGAGHWTPGTSPTSTGSYNRVATAFLNGDTYLDIVATSAEFQGIHVWYGSAAGTWTAAPALETGHAFFGLTCGDVNQDGNWDLVVGANEAGLGIRVFLNDGAGGWSQGTPPTSSGIYKDLVLAQLNDDANLDLVAASQGGGVSVWSGTDVHGWNFWYHPAGTGIFNGLCVADLTLDGSPDLAAAATFSGISIWENLTPAVQPQYLELDPDHIEFHEVPIGSCAHEDFHLNNVSSDTLYNVVVYATNPVFTVDFAAKDTGLFDLLPGETRLIRVTYCPVDEVAEIEAVIVHSTVEVKSVRVTGEGVPYIVPAWSVDLLVANAVGGEGNEQTLSFGAAIGATDSLDVQSGERGLPPWPPSEIFDARFLVLGTEGSLVNIHDFYNASDAFTFQWQPGSAGYPVTITWDPQALPAGTFLMGSALLDTLDMAQNSEYVVPAGLEYVTELTIWTNVYSTFTHDLHDSWQLVSRAVDTGVDSLSVLFPMAVSAFGFNEGYVQTHTLAPGRGYWLDMPGPAQVPHLGQQVRRIQLTLPAGWSLIGAPFDTLQVADIAQSPPGSVRSVYGFGVQYDLASELVPGQGYWIDLSAPCEITLDLDAVKSGPARPVPAGETVLPASVAWELPITIAPSSGGSDVQRQLMIGTAPEATAGLDPALGEREVPPWPPSAVFEARLAGAGNGTYVDLRGSDQTTLRYEIAWRGQREGSSLTLTWDAAGLPTGCSARLVSLTPALPLSPVDMTATGSAVLPPQVAALGGVRIEIDLTGQSEALPRVLALYPNAPNPFNPSTVIAFDLPRPGLVSLEIFDTAGRRVRSLIAGTMPAGHHRAEWDGRDDRGARVASGPYIYRLRHESRELTRKMLLVK